MLNNTLETAQVAKSIKDRVEAELPKNASRSKIKKTIVKFIVDQIGKTEQNNEISKTNRQLHKTAGFEGSPLYLFLLDELVSLDKGSTCWACPTTSSTITSRSSCTTSRAWSKT